MTTVHLERLTSISASRSATLLAGRSDLPPLPPRRPPRPPLVFLYVQRYEIMLRLERSRGTNPAAAARATTAAGFTAGATRDASDGAAGVASISIFIGRSVELNDGDDGKRRAERVD